MDAHLQFGALADPTRRRIFETLAARPRSVGDLAGDLPVTRPAVSQHLKVLAEAGLVAVERRGTLRVYSVDPGGLEIVGHWVDSYWTDVVDRFVTAARKEHAMEHHDPTVPPVTKTRTVPLPVEDAFSLFTERLDTWWPLHSHSIAADGDGQHAVSVRFEGRVGGRVVEVDGDGGECSWADVIAWQPPHRFVLSWHPSLDPAAASILEVRFDTVDGGTELRLEHRGWEEFGSAATALRDGYESGWDLVLQPYEQAAVGLPEGKPAPVAR